MEKNQNNLAIENQEENEVDSSQKYLEKIEELDKKIEALESKNQKLNKENKNLFDKVMNGESASAGAKHDDGPTIKELAVKLASVDKHPLSNLEYVETQLQLREKLMEAGHRDPFLPAEGVNLTANEEQLIQNYVESLEEMVQQANGDPVAFNILLNNRVAENKVPIRKK